jgi:hypothetical protein
VEESKRVYEGRTRQIIECILAPPLYSKAPRGYATNEVVSSNVSEYSKLLDVGAAMRFPIVLDARETDAVELENAQEAMSVPNAKRDNSCPSESVNLLGTDENNRTGKAGEFYYFLLVC